MALLLVRPVALVGQRAAASGLLVVLLEVARRSVEAVRDRWSGRPRRGARGLAALSTFSNRALLAFAVTFPFVRRKDESVPGVPSVLNRFTPVFQGPHVLDGLSSTSGIVGALRSFAVAFLLYLPVRRRLVLV